MHTSCGTIVAYLVGCLLLGSVLAGCGASESFQFTLLFDDMSGLKRGDPVIYKETEIGHVKAVALKKRPEGGGMAHVTVGIQQRYRDLLYHQMDFAIKSRELLGKDKHILVQDTRQVPHPNPRRIAAGDYVIGSRSFLQVAMDMTRTLVQNLEKTFAQAEGDTRELMQRVSQALAGEMSRHDLDQLIGKLEKQAEKATDNMAEQMQELIARLKSK